MTDELKTTDIAQCLRDLYPTHPLIMSAADEIERLRAEGTKRMNWIIGLIDHAKSLGIKYAAEWHFPPKESNDE